jgi:alpha-L-rhamnosidase
VKIKQGICIVFAVLLISVLLKEYQKAQKLNRAKSSVNIEESIQFNGIGNNQLIALEGLNLNRHSAVEYHKTSSDSCFFIFENTWFGTIEINFPHRMKSNYLSIKLGELAKNNHVLDTSNADMPSIAYFEKRIDLRSVRSTKLIVDVPRKILPNNKKLPFKLQGVLPFKYVEITEGCDVSLEGRVTQLALTYPFNVNNSSFNSNDLILNEIYSLSKHTIKATSFAGLYIDGYREVKPYEADSYINQLGHYAIDSDFLMARKTQEYLLMHGTWPTEWIMHSVLMAYRDYMQTGDKIFIRDNYNVLKARTLIDLSGDDFLISSKNQTVELRTKAGIVAERLIDIIDWPQPERNGYSQETIKLTKYLPAAIVIAIKKLRLAIVRYLDLKQTAELYEEDITHATYNLKEISAVNTVVNAFHFEALTKLSFLAKEIGNIEDAIFFEKRAVMLKESMLRQLFNEEKGLFVDAIGSSHSSIHANVFALIFGLVPIENKETVLNFILSQDKGSVYFYQYLLEALYQNGKGSEALSILTSKGKRSWHYMKHVLGSDMTTESWDFDVKKNMDYNHAWATAPVNIIPRYIAGIRPLSPRYKHFIVAPIDEGLDSFEAVVPTLDGNVSLNMNRTKSKVTYILDFTGKKMANVSLMKPKCEKFEIILNNKKIGEQTGEGIIRLNTLAAGHYKISLKCVNIQKKTLSIQVSPIAANDIGSALSLYYV